MTQQHGRCPQCIALESMLEVQTRYSRKMTIAFFCLIALYAGLAGMLFWTLSKGG